MMDSLSSEEAREDPMTLISECQRRYDLMVKEQEELVLSRDEKRKITKDFKQRTEKLVRMKEEEEVKQSEQMACEQEKLRLLREEAHQLEATVQEMEAALAEAKAENLRLGQQSEVFSLLPCKEVAFKGQTVEGDGGHTFEMTSRIVYPMRGGTALIAFEQEGVARSVLDRRSHKVMLEGNCFIEVESQQVHLVQPRLVELDVVVCPQRVQISELPRMDGEDMLKLQNHFSKSFQEEEEEEEVDVKISEFLPDANTVVLKCKDENVAKRLMEKPYHQVNLKDRHSVRVGPHLQGTISNLESAMLPCSKMVLLTGIPPVMERENLQDMLVIHFQKTENGGGEVDTVIYNPQGQKTSVVFEGTTHETTQAAL